MNILGKEEFIDEIDSDRLVNLCRDLYDLENN